MKSRWALWAIIAGSITVILALSNITPTFAQGSVSNLVHAELGHGNWYVTDEDSITNVPIIWDHQWFTNLVNLPDGGPPVLNPKVQFQTDLALVRFWPNDPLILTAQPSLGLYTWNFSGLEIKEPAHLPISAWETEDTLIVRPRFTASRSIVPETLTGADTLQTISVTFRLEEPLPSGVNQLGIYVGSPVSAYQSHRLVEGHFVSQIPVEGWNAGTDGVSAWWYAANPSTVTIGNTYRFQAVLESVKSPDLLGSPIFKPGVMVGYLHWQNWPTVTGNSVTIASPDGIMKASFSADNIVDWRQSFNDSRFDFWFRSVVSPITLPPLPFHVLISADVRIEPETVNLKSKGVMTAFVRLPKEYSVKDVDVSTVKCQGAPAVKGVIDGDTLIIKCNRQDLRNIQPGKEVRLLVTGQLADGSIFEGTDVVRVIQ